MTKGKTISKCFILFGVTQNKKKYTTSVLSISSSTTNYFLLRAPVVDPILFLRKMRIIVLCPYVLSILSEKFLHCNFFFSLSCNNFDALNFAPINLEFMLRMNWCLEDGINVKELFADMRESITTED